MPVRGSSKLTGEQCAEIASRYRAEPIGTPALAACYGVSRSLIARVLREAGVDTSIKTRIAILAAAGLRPGPVGCKWSAESRAKMSAIRKGGKPTTLGKVWTPEERDRMSELQKQIYAERPEQREHQRRAALKGGATQVLPADEKAARDGARHRIKLLLRRLLTRQNRRKHARIADILGYTAADLRAHLEPMFGPTMRWDVPESFHIDHIVPVRVFLERGIVDFAVINALANLRPLTPAQNRAKSDRYEGDFDADLASILASIGRVPLQAAA